MNVYLLFVFATTFMTTIIKLLTKYELIFRRICPAGHTPKNM